MLFISSSAQHCGKLVHDPCKTGHISFQEMVVSNQHCISKLEAKIGNQAILGVFCRSAVTHELFHTQRATRFKLCNVVYVQDASCILISVEALISFGNLVVFYVRKYPIKKDNFESGKGLLSHGVYTFKTFKTDINGCRKLTLILYKNVFHQGPAYALAPGIKRQGQVANKPGQIGI